MTLKKAKNILFVSLLLVLTALLMDGCTRYRLKMLFVSKKLEGINLSGFDLYNLDLNEINLARSKLVRTNFSFALMKNAKLMNTDLRLADLSSADLTGADLRGANLRSAVLQNAVLRRANLIDAYLYDADLTNTDLREAVFVSGYTDDSTVLKKINSGELTNYAHLRNADLGGAAVSGRWKKFIEFQVVKNFNRIVWVK